MQCYSEALFWVVTVVNAMHNNFKIYKIRHIQNLGKHLNKKKSIQQSLNWSP